MLNAADVLVARPATDYDQQTECGDSEANEETDSDAPALLESPIGASAVMQFLEDLIFHRKMTATQVVFLKDKYLKLCSYLSETRENEFNLVHQAKLFTTELERLDEETEKLRRQLERACEEIRSEIGKRCGEGRQLAQTLKDAQQTIQEEEKLVTLTHTQLETLRVRVFFASTLTYFTLISSFVVTLSST
ncbi:hypothetical protein P879_06635 [Paragonimus westermani]|uniref:Uncharacterized protein n=1 Tax=Paragonimus westermani TaxID=34504 RepID=A0A8T0DCR5_9TREM|nr:hypothetical protein P879_06635 [Paragonimus westermani]